MKPFLFLLLILPAGLNAQQPSVSVSKSQLPVGTNDFSASITSIAILSSKGKDIAATIKSAKEQISSLKSSIKKIQAEIADLKDQIQDIGSDQSKKDQKEVLEKRLAILTEQLNESNKKISELQNYIKIQMAEIEKLEDSIDQMRKKMEAMAARDRQKAEKSKQTDETKKTTTADEEKALAYAHVKILLDSLPGIASRLTVAERNIVSGLNSRFNSDAEFRSATTAYIKLSKASNYIEIMSRAGSSTDLQNRLLNAAREELVILSRN